MFRRAKKTGPEIPKPPSKEEILNDLETFHVIQPIRERNRDEPDAEKQRQRTSPTSTTNSPSATSPSAPAQPIDDSEWWTKFEYFLADIDELKNYRQYLQFKKNDLADLDNFITEESNEIQRKLREHIEEAKRIIAEDT